MVVDETTRRKPLRAAHAGVPAGRALTDNLLAEADRARAREILRARLEGAESR